MKLEKKLQIAFLCVGTLTVLEFIFVRGLFTWLMAVGGVLMIGGLNILFAIKCKEWIQACMYLLCVLALCMGYYVVI